MEITPLRTEELPVLRQLMNQYFREFFPAQDPESSWDDEYFDALLRGLDAGTHAVLLAWQDTDAVGFALVRIENQWYRESARGGIFEEFYVAPAHRRKGIGASLVQRSVEEMRVLGATSIRAPVLRVNMMGLLFWQRMGFNIEVYDLYLSQQ